jgi:HEAT repeat protein
MDPVTLGSAVVAAILVVAAVRRGLGASRAGPRSTWLEAFRLADVSPLPDQGSKNRLAGTRGSLTVTIEGGGEAVELSAAGLAHGVQCAPRNRFGDDVALEPGAGVGDPDFEAVAVVRGDESVIRALLDHETRRALGMLLSGQLRFETGAGTEMLSVVAQVRDAGLRVRVPRDARDLFAKVKHPEIPPPALRPIVELAERLVGPQDLAGRIADNTASEPIPAVRIANLRHLASQFPHDSATRPALARALADPADEVRLEAARALGAEGVRTLLRIAVGRASRDAPAAEAIALLGSRFEPGHARWALRRAIAAGRHRVVSACLERLVGKDDERSVSSVAAALRSQDDAVARAASNALGRAGGPGFEDAMIAALEHRLVDVQVAAVSTLGRIGSARAVAPLGDWANRHALDRWVRGDARQAIAQIQSRLPGASPGQLSIAGAEAGQVSLVEEDKRGQVSLQESEKSGSG